MKTSLNRLARWSMLLLPLLIVGCASTPKSRIYDNLAYFETMPEEVQENLRLGKIDLGYEKKAVEIAYGVPDSIYTRKSAEETQEIWAYLGYAWEDSRYTNSDRYQPLGDGFDRRYERRLDDRTSYERVRVIFKGGKVSAIEELKARPLR